MEAGKAPTLQLARGRPGQPGCCSVKTSSASAQAGGGGQLGQTAAHPPFCLFCLGSVGGRATGTDGGDLCSVHWLKSWSPPETPSRTHWRHLCTSSLGVHCPSPVAPISQSQSVRTFPSQGKRRGIQGRVLVCGDRRRVGRQAGAEGGVRGPCGGLLSA